MADELDSVVSNILGQVWDSRDGKAVPSTADVKFGGGAVRLEATMLYADLADSTELAMNQDRRVAAKVYKCFLACASRLVKAEGGYIRSFDGDRVMGVFVGDCKNTSATKCALKINYAFLNVITPKLLARYETLRSGSYQLAHCVGIDVSEVLVVRGGIRNDNDLLWVGQAPNVAAKLSAIRQSPYHTLITEAVYKRIADEAKYGPNNEEMWEARSWSTGPVATVYRSRWMWTP